MLTQYRLKQLLNYCPTTGIFTWASKRKRFNIGDRVIGSPMKNGYLRVKLDGKSYKLHKLAYLFMVGYLPARNILIDHEDGNPSNNAWCNLRLVNPTDSNKNRRFKRGKLSGIEFTPYGTYRVRIRLFECYKHVGTFKTLEGALDAKQRAYAEHGFHPNHGT